METLTVLDTDVCIDHFRGLAAATAYIQALPVAERATTDITVMELYQGAAHREQLTTIGQFLERHHVTRLPVVTCQRGPSSAACGFWAKSMNREATWRWPCGCMNPPITPKAMSGSSTPASVLRVMKAGMMVW